MTLTAGGAGVALGGTILGADWSAGFDHAALVAAGRSRADGYDLRIEHSSGSTVGIVQFNGLNTAGTTIDFLAVAALAAAGVDAGYRLVFGNMDATAPSLVAPTASALFPVLTPAAVPALAFPCPGFPILTNLTVPVIENSYPTFPSTRRRVVHQNPEPDVDAIWDAISPEDFYELKAYVASLKGAGLITSPPSWLGTGWGYVLLAARWSRGSANGYHAELTFREVHA